MQLEKVKRLMDLYKLLDNYPSRVAYAQTCFGYCDENGVKILVEL